MKKSSKLSCIWLIVVALLLAISCKKSSTKKTLPSGTGQFIIDNVTFATNDTLTDDLFNSGKDLTMWPTTSLTARGALFIYDMPSASSGTTTLSDGSSISSLTPYILGTVVSGGDSISYASVAGEGSITKTGATSFTFSCTVANQLNSSDTLSISGSGTY
ncbi:MAG TPA: hypothetical protein VKR32_11680 [Puia sp.]|nr:hypothetical protein [Puia sp.]